MEDFHYFSCCPVFVPEKNRSIAELWNAPTFFTVPLEVRIWGAFWGAVVLPWPDIKADFQLQTGPNFSANRLIIKNAQIAC